MDKDHNPDSLPEKDNNNNDEEIIDLTQIMENDEEDDIIDLNNVLEAQGTPEEDEIPLLEVVPEDDSHQQSEKTEDDVIDLKELTTGDEPDASAPGDVLPDSTRQKANTEDLSETLTPSEKQLENALVRAIEKVYGDKIEQLLIQTIEKTIKQEIDEIKQALLDEKP
jgi:hypothetical protein